MRSAVIKLSGREDLNLRPHRPERCALAGLRHAPNVHAAMPHQRDFSVLGLYLGLGRRDKQAINSGGFYQSLWGAEL